MLHLVQAMLSINVAVLIYKLQVWMQKIVVRHVALLLKDDEGNLKREYCSDPDNMGVHFTDEGCKVWIDYLRTHVS